MNNLGTGDTGAVENFKVFLDLYGYDKNGNLTEVGAIFTIFYCIALANGIVNYINSRRKCDG